MEEKQLDEDVELARAQAAEEAAREECAELVNGAEAALSKKNYKKAESLFSQAACYAFADERILKGLWEARTRGFTDYEPFYNRAYAEEFASCDEKTKAYVRERVGARLSEERAAAEKEQAAIAPAVLEKQQKRQTAFDANRRYYAVRLAAFLIAFLISAIGVTVASTYIVRTPSIAPLVVTAVFGGIAFIALVVIMIFARKVYLANKLCTENAKLSSTEQGARLALLQERLYCLYRILCDDEAE